MKESENTKYFRAVYNTGVTAMTFVSESYEAAVQYAREALGNEFRLSLIRQYADFANMVYDQNPLRETLFEENDDGGMLKRESV